MEWSFISDVLLSLLTLTFLEIVLGVDNLVFISIVSSRLPQHQQKLGRRIGLLFALVTRLLLLASVLWIIGLTKPFISFWNYTFSGRDLFLILGGLFLLYKSTAEIHTEFEGESPLDPGGHKTKRASLNWVIAQIALLDIVFSLDSIFTAVGMTQHYWIMATAITIAVITMIFASEPLSRFIMQRPTIKMLALSFLLLIGTVLIADGFKFHVPREYIYFALSFSVLVETLNQLIARRRKNRRRNKSS